MTQFESMYERSFREEAKRYKSIKAEKVFYTLKFGKAEAKRRIIKLWRKGLN